MGICSWCQEDHDGGLAYCKKYKQAYYQSHKADWKARRKAKLKDRQAWKNNHSRRKREFVNTYKETMPCKDCGEKFACWVMEFDHRDRAQKRLAISAMISATYSLEAVKTEMKKCDLVCANCHRMRTAIQLGWTRSTYVQTS